MSPHPFMNHRRIAAAWLSTAVIAACLVPPSGWARGGGGGHRGGDGGHWGLNHPGYQGSHPAYGAGSRPSWNGNGNRNTTINRTTNYYNRDGQGWNRGWANGGYWGSRPWQAGWYGAGGAGWGGWGWWGANAAAWGVAGLASGVAITSLVNQAADASKPVIVVPQTSYQLNYGSLEAVGSYGASFTYSLGDAGTLMGAVNCQEGLLNAMVPQTVPEAQLLNAVCAVAYGRGD
ncbi:MAG: hypothetical protein VKO00_03025 [Cyanobacteriota bacterium]|nr:hypothetical protein [Cyanobacteriota bacterium]